MTANLRLVQPARTENWTEDDIKQLARRNRRAAIDLLVAKYREKLFYHALYIVKDYEEAYDVVQEVFIRSIRESRLFNEDFRVKAWLYRVTSNLCFNLVRNRRRRLQILDATPREEHSVADQVDHVFGSERHAEVYAAMQLMTDDHKEILTLRYYDDLSYAEISEVLDVKLGTVMSRLSRARARLLEMMAGDDEDLLP